MTAKKINISSKQFWTFWYGWVYLTKVNKPKYDQVVFYCNIPVYNWNTCLDQVMI